MIQISFFYYELFFTLIRLLIVLTCTIIREKGKNEENLLFRFIIFNLIMKWLY